MACIKKRALAKTFHRAGAPQLPAKPDIRICIFSARSSFRRSISLVLNKLCEDRFCKKSKPYLGTGTQKPALGKIGKNIIGIYPKRNSAIIPKSINLSIKLPIDILVPYKDIPFNLLCYPHIPKRENIGEPISLPRSLLKQGAQRCILY